MELEDSFNTSNIRYRGKKYSSDSNDEESTQKSATSASLSDGGSVDFVLVNEVQEESVSNSEQRRMFEHNLIKEGLVLEPFVDVKNMLRFVKIQVPWESLATYAETLKYNMPIMKNDLSKTRHQFIYGSYALPPIEKYFTAPFSREKLKYFLIGKRDSFFNDCQRGTIVAYILNQFGLERLADQGVFIAGFPLHSGPVHGDGIESLTGILNLRCRLFLTWGRLACICYQQPIDHIRSYFGEMTGFYFALIGLYTTMLVPLSVVGVSVFVFGVVTMVFKETANEICDVYASGNITMCPLSGNKRFWKLQDYCSYSKVNSVVDNSLTVLYACVIHIWSTVFLERWKTYEATLAQSWSVNNITTKEDQVVRYQYLGIASKRQTNPVTGYEEYVIEPRVKYMRLAVSFSFMVLSLFVAYIEIFLVFIMRLRTLRLLVKNDMDTVSAAVISSFLAIFLFIILNEVMDIFFLSSAKFITSYEQPRTRRDWETSYTVKTAVFRFLVNMLYIAYFIRAFSANEPIKNLNQSRLDLCIDIAMYIIFKQIIAVGVMIAKEKAIYFLSPLQLNEDIPMEADYKLFEFQDEYLTDEYIGFLLQYGIIMCFGYIFPLISLFAFLNNKVLIRLSANRMLTAYRRPVGRRRNGIGNWLTMLKLISKVSRYVTSLSLFYMSDFTQHIVYTIDNGGKYDDAGYLEFSLSIANVSHFKNAELKDEFANEQTCRYWGFYKPYQPYAFSAMHYRVLAHKFIFVILFNVTIELVSSIVCYFISGLKKIVRLQQLREAYLNQKLMLERKA